MRLSIKALGLGLLMGLLGLFANAIPAITNLEIDLELQGLFALRGPRPPPEEVVIVAIDRESSKRFGLPNAPGQWPRSLHAQLVRNLANEGAQVIVFDMFFKKPRDPIEDRLFAEAIRDAGNVVLFEYLEREDPTPGAAGDPLLPQVVFERRVPPIPELAQAAVALAPFPLPRIPIRVNQFWLYKRGAGDVPTLPVVALHVYALPFYDEWLPLLSEVRPSRQPFPDNADALRRHGVATFARNLHHRFQTNPTLASELLNRLQDDVPFADHRSRSLFTALIEMASGGDSRYLDFYGPPRSITTVPYHRVFQGGPKDSTHGYPVTFSGKAVFVGFSAQQQPQQQDGHYTVFSQPDGLDISGVEIAATAFANLLERRSIKPLKAPLHLLLVALWGIALGTLFLLLPATLLPYVAPALAAGYLGVTYGLFASYGLWLPVIIPQLQVLLALIGALLWRYLYARREHQKIREVFGYYLPGRIVDELTQANTAIMPKGQLVYGICLASDAEQYTKLSETLEPERLQLLLNRYYQTLFEPVRQHSGSVSDVVGDAMLAIWTTTAADRSLQEQACAAALDIIAAVDDFNRRTPEARLPTRLGLHCGEIFLGNVGAGYHYEYRAVGDIVNTATRIQGLNKQLGTRLLASSQMIEGLNRIATREVGSFRLVGKTRPLVIHEVIGWAEQLDTARRDHYAQFALGLASFRKQRWREARNCFRRLLAMGDDGPSRYYLRLCAQYVKTPPLTWDGVVNLEHK